MKRKLVFIFSVLVLSFIVIQSFGGKTEKKVLGKAKEQEVVSKVAENSGLQSQLKEMGAVTLELTPVQLETNKEVLFNLELNTHSVELDYDYTKIIKMYDQNRDEYLVKEWTGEAGGHHLSGQVVFAELKDTVTSVTIEIEGIDNQSGSFNWKL